MKKVRDILDKYGEGTKWDLDYGKLVILGLCIYIAIKVSLCSRYTQNQIVIFVLKQKIYST